MLGKLFSGGAAELVKGVGGVIDSLHTSGEEKLEAERKIKELVANYDKLKDVKSPTIENYTTYTETPEQLTRFEQCEKLINTIYEVEESTGVKAYPFDVTKAFRRILDFNIRTNKFQANTYWVKTGRQI